MLLKWAWNSWNSWNGLDALETLETPCVLSLKWCGTPRVSHEKFHLNFKILCAGMRALETLETLDTLLKRLITLAISWNALEMRLKLLKLLILLKHLKLKHDWKLIVNTIYRTLQLRPARSKEQMRVDLSTSNRPRRHQSRQQKHKPGTQRGIRTLYKWATNQEGSL